MKRKIKTNMRRRAFLTGTGACAIGLPFLEGLPHRSAWAAGESPRFGLFIVTANGVVQQERSEPERFWPTQTGALTSSGMEGFKADRVTGELSAWADRLLIVRGVNYPGGVSGCGHSLGLVQSLTGRGPNGGSTDNRAVASSKSIDTLIGEHFGEEPLTLYAGAKGGFINEKLSFSAPGQVRAAEGNPFNVYLRLQQFFGSGGDGGPDEAAQLLVARRQSFNDLIREELNDLKSNPRLSSEDVRRLDQHFASLRDLELDMVDMANSCSEENVDVSALEAISNGDAFRRNGTIEEVVRLQLQLAAVAFACNAYRVATLQAGDGTDGTRYTINGQTVESFHHISHRIASDGSSGPAIPGAFESHEAIDRIRMNTFAQGIERWAETTMADGGSLLDHGFMMWSSHNATGPLHGWNNLPYIIAGSGGGVLRQGQYVDAGGVLNERILNTLARANGVPEGDANMIGSGFIDSMLA